MRWEVKKIDDDKWGIMLCEEFWKYPDKPVCYGASSNESTATQRVEWMNENEAKLEAEEHKEESD